MKIVGISIIWLLIAVSAQESYIPNARHPDEPNKCYLRETGDFVDFGQKIMPIGTCRRFTCRDDYVFLVNHCSRYMKPENCEIIPTDLTKPYPDCCVKLRCTLDDGTVEVRNTGA